MTDTIIADVSEFQQVIDWPTYGAHVPGVIIRAHNGNRPDNYWQRNLAGSRANVTWRGFYQYLPANVDPVAAARAFQATTGPLEPGEVAILDLEEGTGDQRGRRQAWLDTLQDEIEWTYSGLSFARSHLPGVRIDWIAAYGQSEPTDSHTMWQFTNAHTFPGIARPCDASVFHGTILPGLLGGFGRGIGSSTGATLTTQEPDMDASQDQKLTAIFDAIFTGGTSTPYGASLLNLVDDIPNRVWKQPVSRVVGAPTTILQDNVDGTTASLSTATQIAGLTAAIQALAPGAGVDPAAIAAAITAAVEKAVTSIHATTTLTTGV